MRLDLDLVKVDPSAEYPNLGIYSFARGAFGKPPLIGLSLRATVLYRIKAGQFVYLKLNGYEGAYARVPEELDGFFVTNEFPTFTCDPTSCRSDWIACYFKKPSVWASMAHHSKGTPTRRQRVNPPAILAHEVWLPPLADQDRIAEVLTAHRQYQSLDTFEKDAAALRRSILSKAFRGEL
jgi:type I restriction enzyme S subunit